MSRPDCEFCDTSEVFIAKLEAENRMHINNGIALDKENEKLREALDTTIAEVCEGYCQEDGGCGKFEDCQGCDIFNRAALEVSDE
jgi:hypothetical protein